MLIGILIFFLRYSNKINNFAFILYAMMIEERLGGLKLPLIHLNPQCYIRKTIPILRSRGTDWYPDNLKIQGENINEKNCSRIYGSGTRNNSIFKWL